MSGPGPSGASDPGSPRPASHRLAAAGLALVLLVHAIESVRMFPTYRALLDDDQPVLLVDHALHLYHGAIGSRSLLDHGTPWGYDPCFMAGYPQTPIWDSSSNPSIVFQALAGGGYHPGAYNRGLLACSIFALACIPAGAIAAGLTVPEALAATVVAWLYFHGGWPEMLWRSGLFAFTTASGLLVLLIGLLCRFDRKPNGASWAALTATGALLWLAHVMGPILALGAVLGTGAAGLRRHGWRWWLSLPASAAVVVAVNLAWLGPYWRFRSIRSARGFFMAPQSGWFLVRDYLAPQLDARLGLAILVLGVAGLGAWLRRGHTARAATFGGAALVCLALAAFGGGWSVTRVLEPFRFKVPAHLVLAVPAGWLLAAIASLLARRAGGGWGGMTMATLAGVAVLAAIAGAQPSLAMALARQLVVTRPMVAGLRPEMRSLVRWLEAETDSSARILFEDQLRLLEPTDAESTHWTPLLPVLLGEPRRTFIGGLYQTAFIAHHQLASFGDFHLGGRPIEEWFPGRIGPYCERFNIGWVACWSPLSRFCFDRWPQASRVATLPRYHTPGRPVAPNRHEWETIAAREGPAVAEQYCREADRQYAIYRVERAPSWFLSGSGRLVAADWNRVELADVRPENGGAVLSLHWLDTWRADPPLRLEPYPLPGDPAPLTRIVTDRPVPRLVLRNAYGP